MPSRRETSTSKINNLLRTSFVPQQTVSIEALQAWESGVAQFARLMKEAGIVLERLTDNDIMSHEKAAGLIEQYIYQIDDESKPLIKDINFREGVKVGTKICQFFTLADVNSFPSYCSSRITHDGYSTDRTVFPVSYAAPVGLFLPINHITTTFIFLGDASESKRRNERKAKRTLSLAQYSRENAISNEAINEYLHELTADSRRPCFLHLNVMTLANG